LTRSQGLEAALPLAAVVVLHAGAAQMGCLTTLEWLPMYRLPA
jgi:hypothetical protein